MRGVRWFAVGEQPVGVVAIGVMATGVIAIGPLALGLVAVGQLARGGVAVGQLAVGIVSFGQLSLGLGWSGGQLAVGAIGGPGQLVLRLAPPLSRTWPEQGPSWALWRVVGLVLVAIAVWYAAAGPLLEAWFGQGGLFNPLR